MDFDKKSILPRKRSACGVRTSFKKRTNYNQTIFTTKNEFNGDKKERMRRTHWPQKDKQIMNN